MRKARSGGDGGGGGAGKPPSLPTPAPGPISPSGGQPQQGGPVTLDPMQEVGASGLQYMSGIITDDLLRELDGKRGIRIFSEMHWTDALLAGLGFAIEMLMRRAPWRADKAEGTQEDADFLESCMGDMSSTWPDTLAEQITFLWFGWAYCEVCYKYRRGDSDDPTERSDFKDNKIGWRKIPLRSQDSLYRWELDPNGGVRGMVQSAPPTYTPTFIPIEKSVLFRTSIYKGNPQGRSILYGSYKSWYMKKHIENIEAIGIERDLTGLPILWVPQQYLDTTITEPGIAQTRQRFYDTLRRIKRDQHEGLMLPLAYDEKGNKLFDFHLATTGGRRQFDTSSIIMRLDRAMARTCIADFLMLGEFATGSFALSKNKTDLFVEAISAWQDMIAEVYNRHAVPKLFKLNGKATGPYPKLTHGKIRAIDLAEVATFIKAMADAGAPIFPNPELLSELFEEAGLPPAVEAESTEAPPDQPTPPQGPSPAEPVTTPSQVPLPTPAPPQTQPPKAGSPPPAPPGGRLGKGGPGSGHFGHAGRPGQVGGSAPAGGATSGQAAEEPLSGPFWLSRVGDYEGETAEVATELGFPADKIKLRPDSERPDFTVGGEHYHEGGHYDPRTGEITMYLPPTIVPGGQLVATESQVSKRGWRGMVVHEISHDQLEKASRIYTMEAAQIKSHDYKVPNTERLKTYLAPDGSIRPEAAKLFPTYAALDPYLSGKGLANLAEDDGVTPYSESYWRARSEPGFANYYGFIAATKRAVNETLAEVARLEDDRTKGVPENWRKFHSLVVEHSKRDPNSIYRGD